MAIRNIITVNHFLKGKEFYNFTFTGFFSRKKVQLFYYYYILIKIIFILCAEILSFKRKSTDVDCGNDFQKKLKTLTCAYNAQQRRTMWTTIR